ncbi:hypothetical protein ACEN8K_42095, partial [Variovorax sp. CT11-76]
RVTSMASAPLAAAMRSSWSLSAACDSGCGAVRQTGDATDTDAPFSTLCPGRRTAPRARR